MSKLQNEDWSDYELHCLASGWDIDPYGASMHWLCDMKDAQTYKGPSRKGATPSQQPLLSTLNSYWGTP